MTRITSRPAVLLVLLASLATFFVVAPVGAASASTASAAQTCTDPYGCPGTTTTTTPGSALPQCIVSQNSGRIGVDVDVTVTNVPLGVRVNLLLNGLQVDFSIAGGSGSAASTVGDPSTGEVKSARSAKSAAQTTGLADVHFDFRVPSGPSGAYTLVAVGDGFHCDCFPFTILRDVSAGSDTNNGGNNNGGNLARTGFTVLGLLVLAAVLLVIGRAMVEASRRRSSGTPAA